MKEDSRAIFRAASEAQKAVDYIVERTTQADRALKAFGNAVRKHIRDIAERYISMFIESGQTIKITK